MVRHIQALESVFKAGFTTFFVIGKIGVIRVTKIKLGYTWT